MRTVILLGITMAVGCQSAKENNDLASLADHRFWKKRPTSQRLVDYVAAVESMTRGDLLEIEEDNSFKVYRGTQSFGMRATNEAAGAGRKVVIDFADRETRPDRQEIIGILKRGLDEADFRKPRRSSDDRLRDFFGPEWDGKAPAKE